MEHVCSLTRPAGRGKVEVMNADLPPLPSALLRCVEAALDEIRPALAQDGGFVEVVAIEDGVLKVDMQGECSTCAISHITLKLGIERLVKERCPQITAVESVGGFAPGFDEPLWDYQRTAEGEPPKVVRTESPAAKLMEKREGTPR